MNKKTLLEVAEYNEELQKLSSSFFCGNQFIDNFLKGHESLETDICKTFVMLQTYQLGDKTKQEIIGFYSLSSDSVLCFSELDSIMLEGGAIRIFMFAIDERYKHKKIRMNGEKRTYASVLILDCLNFIDEIVNTYLGAKYIILNSTKEGYYLYKYTGNFMKLTEDEDLIMSDVAGNGDCVSMYKYIKEDLY